jgi:hypothetical protein
MNLTGYRTLIVAAVLAVVQVVAVLAPGTVLPSADDIGKAADVLLAVLTPAAMILMRLLTKGPVGGGKE